MRRPWNMGAAVDKTRKRLRRYRVVRGVLGEEDVTSISSLCTQLPFNTEADSVDDVPAYYASLMSQGTEDAGAVAQRVLRILEPVVEERILPLVRDALRACGVSAGVCGGRVACDRGSPCV